MIYEIWKSGHDDSQTYFQERHIISPFILLMTIAYYKFPPSFMLQPNFAAFVCFLTVRTPKTRHDGI